MSSIQHRQARRHRLILVTLMLLFAPLAGCGTGATPGIDDKVASGATAEPSPAGADSAGTGLHAHSQLRFDCEHDSQCAIMDIGNCCGHYPACVNAQSRPDPAGIAAECQERGIGSICGFPSINACECRAGRCEGILLDSGAGQ